MSTLEILISVVSILSILTVFYVYTSIKIVKQHNAIINGYKRLNNEYKQQIVHFNGQTTSIRKEMSEVNQQMKDDSYASISEVNKKLEDIDKDMRAFIHKSNLQDGIMEKNIKQSFNDIRNLSQQIRMLRENPNMTSQY